MRRLIVGALAAIGAASLLFLVAVAIFAWQFTRSDEPELPERTVLYLDLRESLPETPAEDPLASLGLGTTVDAIDALLALRAAREDERVVGLVARVDGDGPGFAQAQELRAAVHALGEAGKFTVAFADAFGEFGPGMRGYYLASAFDEILMQPLGAVGLTGLMVETPLLRGLLDNLGVEPVGGKRGAYKSAADMFTERELTAETREALEAILDSIHGQLVADIAADRGLEPTVVDQLIGRGPYAADEAIEVGLVDRLGFWDAVETLVAERAGDPDQVLIGPADYRAALPAPPDGAPVVAVVHGVGQIQRGKSERGPAQGWILGAETVAAALDEALEDPEVRAILFRVDSPGGSAVASETIGHEVRRAVEAGKPVIVSMGEVAASGGYWISMHASAITARPATLTGSIGVFAGKPVLTGLWDWLGVSWGLVQKGENADMWSTTRGFDAAGEERLDAFLDRTYAAFKAGVAEGRNLEPGAVQEAAEGRVWTGEQAAANGLVDDLGGFEAALARVRDAAGVADDEVIELRRFPRQRSPIEQILEILSDPSRLIRTLPSLTLGDWLPVLSSPPLSVR
ncbi:MAG TPA: signal peptide peptidase SppA [Geminicoccaceae bacterium]